jgi:broad specificity phosphatase PhoE
MTRVHLLRHADVENPHRILYGHLPGFPLSDRGRAEAAAVGRSLREAGIRRIVTSPLERAVETAEIVNAELPQPVPLITDPRLREAEFSRYLQGVAYWQVPLRRPLWFVHRARRGLVPGDETIERMGGRVLEVAFQLVREHPGEPAVLVSHADPLQAAWVVMDGRPLTEREFHRKLVGKAGRLEVDIEADRVLAVNYVPPPPNGSGPVG